MLPSENSGRLKEDLSDWRGARFGCHHVKTRTKGCVIVASEDSDCDAKGGARDHPSTCSQPAALDNPGRTFT
jgi:hypothetical protein